MVRNIDRRGWLFFCFCCPFSVPSVLGLYFYGCYFYRLVDRSSFVMDRGYATHSSLLISIGGVVVFLSFLSFFSVFFFFRVSCSSSVVLSLRFSRLDDISSFFLHRGYAFNPGIDVRVKIFDII